MQQEKSIFVKIHNKICEKLLNSYIVFWTALGYEIGSITTAESFIYVENKIEILESNKDIDLDNIIKYLKHHIMYTDDNFHKLYFIDEPLIIRFKYQNEIYQMCLKQLECNNTDHSVIKKESKCLSAIVKLNDDDDDGICITDKFVEFHGPERNFFTHIPDCITDFSIILKDYKGKLCIFDMMGNQQIYLL